MSPTKLCKGQKEWGKNLVRFSCLLCQYLIVQECVGWLNPWPPVKASSAKLAAVVNPGSEVRVPLFQSPGFVNWHNATARRNIQLVKSAG